jgi:hypothetical protein
MSDVPLQLIVRQRLTQGAEFAPLVQALEEHCSLDPYTVRHRLVGHGFAVLGPTGCDKDGEAVSLLRSHGYQCWRVAIQEPRLAPQRLRGLTVRPDELRFATWEGTIGFQRGKQAVGILADVSHQLHERIVRRHMVQRNVLGVGQVAALSTDEIVQTILKGTPVFDLYLLDEAGAPQSALRVVAGQFDVAGLGERKTLSAVRNLEAIVGLCREYAGDFALYTEFGLGHLPGCEIRTLEGTLADPDRIMTSLTRFGWLMCSLHRETLAGEEPAEQPALAAAAITGGRPDLALAALSGEPGVAAPFPQGTDGPSPPAEPVRDGGLPPPPEQPARRRLTLGTIAAVGGIAGMFGMILLSRAGGFRLAGSLDVILRRAFDAGLIPGLLAGGVLYASGYFLRLKQQIENTPTSRIRSLAMGPVEIHGQVYRKYALISPMSLAACVYYRLRKYRKDSSGKWELQSVTDSSHVPFLLDDGTGRVTVAPSGARVSAKVEQTGFPGEMTMAFGGVSVDDADEKWVEELIHEGTTLYVLGYARPLRAAGTTMRERTIERLRQLKLDLRTLRRYDANGDGRVDAEEWQQARADAEQLAAAEHLAETVHGHLRVQVGKPPRGLPFLIAEGRSESELTARYGWTSAALLVLGVAAAGVALYLSGNFFRLF